jgi:hypothetical protein
MARGIILLCGVVATFLTSVMAKTTDPAPATRPFDPLPEMKDSLDGRDQPRQWKNYTQMHDYFVNGFVNTEGRGLSRMVTPRDLSRYNTLYVEGIDWHIGNVQLISVPKVGEPFAYDTPADATKKTIKNSPCRPLNDGETTALAALKSGKQAVMVEDRNRSLLVGAVRASESCLKCHDDAKKGDLLGAFTYPLLEQPVIGLGAPLQRVRSVNK